MEEIVNNGNRKPFVRNKVSLYLAYAKKSLLEIASVVSQKLTFKVKVENEVDNKSSLNRIVKELRIVQNGLKEVVAVEFPDNTEKLTSAFGKNIEELNETLEKVGSEVVNLQKLQKDVEFPSIQKVSGAVSVSKIPDSAQLTKILEALGAINKDLSKIKLEIPPYPEQKEVIIPPYPEPKEVKIPPFPKVIQTVEGKHIIQAINALKEEIVKIPKGINIPEIDFPSQISIDNFPPQKYPMPVTNINVNSLRGPVRATAIVVKTTVIPLPSTPLPDRRSWVFFNNSEDTDVYIGASDLSIANGMPVGPKQYSPSFDAGQLVDIYGVVASGEAEIRLFEVSMDAIGA